MGRKTIKRDGHKKLALLRKLNQIFEEYSSILKTMRKGEEVDFDKLAELEKRRESLIMEVQAYKPTP